MPARPVIANPEDARAILDMWNRRDLFAWSQLYHPRLLSDPTNSLELDKMSRLMPYVRTQGILLRGIFADGAAALEIHFSAVCLRDGMPEEWHFMPHPQRRLAKGDRVCSTQIMHYYFDSETGLCIDYVRAAVPDLPNRGPCVCESSSVPQLSLSTAQSPMSSSDIASGLPRASSTASLSAMATSSGRNSTLTTPILMHGYPDPLGEASWATRDLIGPGYAVSPPVQQLLSPQRHSESLPTQSSGLPVSPSAVGSTSTSTSLSTSTWSGLQPLPRSDSPLMFGLPDWDPPPAASDTIKSPPKNPSPH